MSSDIYDIVSRCDGCNFKWFVIEFTWNKKRKRRKKILNWSENIFKATTTISENDILKNDQFTEPESKNIKPDTTTKPKDPEIEPDNNYNSNVTIVGETKSSKPNSERGGWWNKITGG